MENPVLFRTKSNTTYLHSSKVNQFLMTHPVLQYLLTLYKKGTPLDNLLDNFNNQGHYEIDGYGSFSKEEIEYYYQKILLLAENGYFENLDIEKKICGRLTSFAVKSSLANTLQVTLEVTDSCNLNCEYCGYGKFYSDYDNRENKNLSFQNAVTLFDYLVSLWNSPLNKSHGKEISIGFYGGEPLLNFSLIRELCDYLSALKLLHNRFRFNMTTNGLLLEKYMDFLVDNDFKLLISLDGNEENNAFRVYKNGNSAYNEIYRNIMSLKKKYPDYFEKKVEFNTVLHNKNSVSEIHDFFTREFNKLPSISEISITGIKPELHKEFWNTYRNFNESLNQAEDYSLIEKDLFIKVPGNKSIMETLFKYSGNVYQKYNELISTSSNQPFIPTGTCLPFARKVFLTVNGKILPCERIGQQYRLGQVMGEKVEINFEEVAKKYNNYYDKLSKQCYSCYNTQSCKQCIFYLDINSEKPICKGFMNQKDFSNFLAARFSNLEEKPEIIDKLMNEVTLV